MLNRFATLSQMTADAMDIVVLEHEASAPAALFAEWAGERGHTLTVLEVPALTRWPDPRESDAVLSLGSDCSVHATPDPWIAQEVEFLRAAHDARVPVLGICFGAQALAKALGGDVARAPSVSVGWRTLPSEDAELVPPVSWFRWHEDVFSVPPGARELARMGEAPLAFVAGRSIGLQFHPEADAELVTEWIGGARRQLAEQGVDEQALRRQVADESRGARERAFDLFDRVTAHWKRS